MVIQFSLTAVILFLVSPKERKIEPRIMLAATPSATTRIYTRILKGLLLKYSQIYLNIGRYLTHLTVFYFEPPPESLYNFRRVRDHYKGGAVFLAV